MPSHFDRFRLLDGDRLLNESGKTIYLREEETGPQIEVPPGVEVPLPAAPVVIIDVETIDP